MYILSQFHKDVIELTQHTTSPGKHCASNAITHLQKAWLIKDIDAEMACFRAITGEEEAATAVFHALQHRRYRGAEKLKTGDHRHKAALRPFLKSLLHGLGFAYPFSDNPQLVIDNTTTSPCLQVRFPVKQKDGSVTYVYPDQPLNYNVMVNGKPFDFEKSITEATGFQNQRKLEKHIKELANIRNRILYAGIAGRPAIVPPIEDFLNARTKGVFDFLTTYLLIACYPVQQRFVQRALYAFLKSVRALPKEDLFE